MLPDDLPGGRGPDGACEIPDESGRRRIDEIIFDELTYGRAALDHSLQDPPA